MKLYDLPILKQLADFGVFEEKIIRNILGKNKVVAVNKRLSKRKAVKFGMKENEERNVSIRKIANGFIFNISGNLYSTKYSNTFGGRLQVGLTKIYFSATRSSGSRSLEKNLAKFGGEIREKLLQAEREFRAEEKKRECKTGC